MPEDDIDMEGEEACGDSACVHLHCWAIRGRVLGYKVGQQNPSPQTIKKIQTNFAEKVKPLLDQLDYELGSYHEAVEKMQMPAIHPPTWSVETLGKIKDIIDNTLDLEDEA